MTVVAFEATQEAAIGKVRGNAVPGERTRTGEDGLARFQVLGRDTDRDLIRSLARRLAQDTPEASALRNTVSASIASEAPGKGGILSALRRSPLVGAGLDLARTSEDERAVDV